MKRWFRPIAYSTILILLAVAILGHPPEPSGDAVVLPTQGSHRIERTRSTVRSESVNASRLHVRNKQAWAAGLFETADQPTSAEAAPVAETLVPASPPDLKILGWMLADATPTVFVAYGNENYTLAPSQSVEDVYRFDKIGDGLAVFTYMPTGETRQYAVSDPALSE